MGKRKRNYNSVSFNIDDKSKYLPPGFERDGINSRTEGQKWQNYVQTAGQLSKSVYTRGSKPDVGEYIYTPIGGKDYDAYGVWVNKETHHAFVVFKGTDSGKEWLLQNPSIGRGTVKRNPYFWDAFSFYEKAMKTLGSEYTVDVTGHSLGGAKAMYVAAQAEKKGYDVHSITYNPGVGHSVREKLYGDMSTMPSKERNLIVRNGNDAVSMMRDQNKANTITYTNTYQSKIDRLRPSWKVQQHSIDQFTFDNREMFDDFTNGFDATFNKNSADIDKMRRIPRIPVIPGIPGYENVPSGPTTVKMDLPGPTPEWINRNLPGGQGGVRNPGSFEEDYVDPYLKPDWEPGQGSRYYDSGIREFFEQQGLSRESMTPEMRARYDQYVQDNKIGFVPKPAMPTGLAPANGMHGHPETYTPPVPTRNEQNLHPGQVGDHDSDDRDITDGESGDPHATHEGVAGPGSEEGDKNTEYLHHDVNNPTHAPSETMSASSYTQALSRFTNNAFGNTRTMSAKGMNFTRFAELSDINGSMAEHARDMLAD